MQDPKDETKFCIVERYEQESSQQYHLNNPVRPPFSVVTSCADILVLEGKMYNLTFNAKTDNQTFDPYVLPLLAKDMDLTRWEEM
jgi:hypothetical protein